MRSKDTMMRLQRFRFEEKRLQVGEIESMIADFQRKHDDLDLQVKAEESRSGVSDPAHFNYSLTAKSIRARRDNLTKSIADLQEQLSEAKAQLEDVAAELRKTELLIEKSGGGPSAPAQAFGAGMTARS